MTSVRQRELTISRSRSGEAYADEQAEAEGEGDEDGNDRPDVPLDRCVTLIVDKRNRRSPDMATTTRKTPIKYRRGKPMPTIRHNDVIDLTTFPLGSRP